MNKAIVTGASGFIGKQLINELLSRNVKIVALDIRFDDGKDRRTDRTAGAGTGRAGQLKRKNAQITAAGLKTPAPGDKRYVYETFFHKKQ